MNDIDEFIAQILAWKTIVIVGWLGAIFMLERLMPNQRMPDMPGGGRARLGRNFGNFAILAILSPLVVLPVTLFAASHSLDWRPGEWGGVTGLVMDLLILDLFLYFWHRANHAIPFLWRFHVIHHLDRWLDSSSALRFHFGEVILSALVRGLFIIFSGMPLASVLIFEVMVLLSSIFQHSNLYVPARLDRLLSFVIVTPGWHWMHHHIRRMDTDSNYANSLTIWDRLFGTKCPNSRRSDMEIGVEGQAEERFIDLQTRPFRRG